MALKPARLQWSDDGSLRSLDYDDIYFQPQAGLDESSYVFLQNNKLKERMAALAAGACFRVAELGFGSGLNFLLTARLFDAVAPQGARLVYASIEKHPILKPDLARIYGFFSELSDFSKPLLEQYPPLIDGFHGLRFKDGRIRLLLALGDAQAMLPALSGAYDAWFLDGFSPAKNPDMWRAEFYADIAKRTAPAGTLSTFSAAGHVRRGLAAAGFTVKKTAGFAKKWAMTTAVRATEPCPPHTLKNVAVLGAGLAGCAAARALADRGHRVVIIDKADACAQGASGNPLGLVYPKLTVDPSPLGEYHSHAFCAARQWLAALSPRHWHACGVAHLDLSAQDTARRERILEQRGYPACYARTMENAGGTQASALFHETAGVVSPADFCAALIDHPHIQKIYGTEIARLEKKSQGWMLFDAQGEAVIIADAVVIALAQESAKLAQTAWIPLRPLRGQVSVIKATPASRALKYAVCADKYIAPAIDGLHAIGATFSKTDMSLEPQRADDIDNVEKLSAALPHLGLNEKDVVFGRAGLRATTPDRLPLVGPCPPYEEFCHAHAGLRADGRQTFENPPYIDGLYISAGFGAHGISGAPLAGEIIAALISGDPLPVSHDMMQHLLPERFILRALKRRAI